MLHPVGPLPTAVYWRRRALVLTLLVCVLGGGGWAGYAAATGRFAGDGAGSPDAAASTPPATPALERVVPSLASVQTSAAAGTSSAAPTAPAAGPCTDDMLGLAVQTPGSGPVGSTPTFQLVVTNLSPVACVRALDRGLQEMVLLDAAGNRLWGSNDCVPVTGADVRTLAPGQAVGFPVQWSGLTSEPTCTAPQVPPAAGSYVVRARLDTKVSPDAAFTTVQL